jgi:hypothetical protein
MAFGIEDSPLATNSPFIESSHKTNMETQEAEAEWCLPSIDIEAKVTDEYLAVGVFTFQNRLDGADESELLMRDLKERLELVVEAED